MNGLELDRRLILDLCDFAGMNLTALASEIGVAVTTIQRHHKGTATTRLSQPTLDKLRARFPDFPGWNQSGTADRRLAFKGFPSQVDPDIVEVDEIDLRYGLGGTYLGDHVTAEKRSFSRSLLRHFTNAAPEHLFWTLGDGDSMEPTIRSGELILIERVQDTPRMGDGIWAFAYGEIGMIKRLRPLPNGTIEMHSDNDRVRPGTASDDEIHLIGRVVAVVKRL